MTEKTRKDEISKETTETETRQGLSNKCKLDL